jgi:hypothetical protein
MCPPAPDRTPFAGGDAVNGPHPRGRVAHRARLAGAAILGAALTAAATTAVAAVTASTPAQLLAAQTPIAAVAADQASAFGVLRREQAPLDAFGGSAAQTPGGVNPQLARSVAVATSSLSDGRVWIVPGNGVICLRIIDPAGGEGWTCAATSAARQGGLVGTLVASPTGPGPAFIEGLVPDGVTQVTVTDLDGDTETLPVSDNVYATTLAAHPAGVAFAAPGQAPVTVPLS